MHHEPSPCSMQPGWPRPNLLLLNPAWCFKFQKGKCKDPKCERRHVCIICDGTDHGGKSCPRRNDQIKGGAKGGARR